MSTQICVVGAGAAGITIAHELIGQGIDVVLLEAGGFEFDPRSQDIYRGELVGEPLAPGVADTDLSVVRLRHFGGSTNHWSGVCRPLSEGDFAPRPWLEVSGWPIDRVALDPWYVRAADIIKLDESDFDLATFVDDHGMPEPPIDTERIAAEPLQSRFTRFGEEYREDLESAESVTVYLNANAIEIEVLPESDAVRSVRAVTFGGIELDVEAELFVVALGGLETPRLLLASNAVRSAGIGNQNDLVGRYFCEHPQALAGIALFNDPLEDVEGSLVPADTSGGTRHHVSLALTEAQIQAEELLGAFAQFRIGAFPTELNGESGGVTALDVARVAELVDGVAPTAVGLATVSGEQELRRDSRVTLGRDLDELGMPRLQLDWKHSPRDRRAIVRMFELLAVELGRLGKGRARVLPGDLVLGDSRPEGTETIIPAFTAEFDTANDETFELGTGNHHLCTTRMAASPSDGVVDENCRVHDVANLYLAGSSVFATGGVVPPTITIVALAARLADHLAGRLNR